MEQQSTLRISERKNLVKAIIIAGLIIGLLDGLAAAISAYIPREITPIVYFGMSPVVFLGRKPSMEELPWPCSVYFSILP